MSEGLPEGWEYKQLGKIADVIDPHPSHRAPEENIQGIPFAGIGDLKENGELNESKVRMVSKTIFDEHENRYKISENTIGFGRVASIGKIINFKLKFRSSFLAKKNNNSLNNKA
jgi:type I restriction enzyme, S subunit